MNLWLFWLFTTRVRRAVCFFKGQDLQPRKYLFHLRFGLFRDQGDVTESLRLGQLEYNKHHLVPQAVQVRFGNYLWTRVWHSYAVRDNQRFVSSESVVFVTNLLFDESPCGRSFSLVPYSYICRSNFRWNKFRRRKKELSTAYRSWETLAPKTPKW